jgi:hypothetical protein
VPLVYLHPAENIILLNWLAVVSKPWSCSQSVFGSQIVTPVGSNHPIFVLLLNKEGSSVCRNNSIPIVNPRFNVSHAQLLQKLKTVFECIYLTHLVYWVWLRNYWVIHSGLHLGSVVLLGFKLPSRTHVINTMNLRYILLVRINLCSSTQVWMNVHKIWIILHQNIFGIEIGPRLPSVLTSSLRLAANLSFLIR